MKLDFCAKTVTQILPNCLNSFRQFLTLLMQLFYCEINVYFFIFLFLFFLIIRLIVRIIYHFFLIDFFWRICSLILERFRYHHLVLRSDLLSNLLAQCLKDRESVTLDHQRSTNPAFAPPIDH